jgi:hypothetical protein
VISFVVAAVMGCRCEIVGSGAHGLGPKGWGAWTTKQVASCESLTLGMHERLGWKWCGEHSLWLVRMAGENLKNGSGLRVGSVG